MKLAKRIIKMRYLKSKLLFIYSYQFSSQRDFSETPRLIMQIEIAAARNCRFVWSFPFSMPRNFKHEMNLYLYIAQSLINISRGTMISGYAVRNDNACDASTRACGESSARVHADHRAYQIHDRKEESWHSAKSIVSRNAAIENG